ncbi:histidine kinase [Pedobacter duraquae]|uniref:Histidine kinase n=2 Tax=Pedobacter duraquae TaxID=425511 RepID=A0A4R6IFS1_9SPHI|nr:histidine kinase [Pedobacter duraquae]
MRLKIPTLIAVFVAFYFLSHSAGWLNRPDKNLDATIFLNHIVNEFSGASFFIFLFDTLITYLVFYLLYPNKGILITVSLYLLIGIPVMIGLRFVIEEIILFQITGHHNYNMKHLTLKYYVFDNIYFTMYYNFVALSFFGVQYERFKKLKEKELKFQARNAELSFLKSQINPHFLFNNLNNIYTLVYQQSTNALPAISKLSDLLRYMLYQKEDFVPLTREIEYLNNFIDLQLLRYDYIPEISVNIQTDIDASTKIIPLSLIPFVENAFKHGDLKDAQNPLTIKLEVKQDLLVFKVDNQKNGNRKDATGGIGLENIKKRLELLNPAKYDLIINETTNHFYIELKMVING